MSAISITCDPGHGCRYPLTVTVCEVADSDYARALEVARARQRYVSDQGADQLISDLRAAGIKCTPARIT